MRRSYNTENKPTPEGLTILPRDYTALPRNIPPLGPPLNSPTRSQMKDGDPFGIGGLWENWKDPSSGEWIRTFAIITTDAYELVADVHDRMPLILAPTDYVRWLSDETDPRELMRPFSASPMRMWPISTRVNKPENDDPSIIEPIDLAAAVA